MISTLTECLTFKYKSSSIQLQYNFIYSCSIFILCVLFPFSVIQLDNADDVEITFEEVDDQCSDIGCIEKEGVDFHIESRETIDLSDQVVFMSLP